MNILKNILHEFFGNPLKRAQNAKQTEPPDTSKFVEAKIRQWTDEVRRNPRDYETITAIGSAYGKLGQHKKAIEYFQKALEINPSYAEASLGMAAAYGFLKRPDDKIAACLDAISLNPNSALAYGNLGTALGKAGRYEESIQALREAVRLKPDFADAHFALGLAYLTCGYVSMALEQLDTLDEINHSLSEELRELIAMANKRA